MTGLREALDALAAELNQKAVAAKTNEADSAYCDAVTMVNALRSRIAAHPAEPAPVASPERVAEVLRQHILFTVDEGSSEEACRCGWKPTGNPVLSFSEHARHKADALLAAGVFRDEATVKAELAELIAVRSQELIGGGPGGIAAAIAREAVTS